MRKFIGLAFLLLSIGNLQAQESTQKPLRLGIGLLGVSYVGDLNTAVSPLEKFYPGMSLSLQFASERLISPQLNTGFGSFIAQDRELKPVEGVMPNKFVQTSFFFADFRLKARFLREKAVHPYLSAGIGLMGYTPKDQEGNSLLDNFATRPEGETYGSMTVAFPLSTGLEIRLSDVIMVGLEYSFRPTGSDYLDNIGTLGLRRGKDKLHSLLLSLYLTFDPNPPAEKDGSRGRDRL